MSQANLQKKVTLTNPESLHQAFLQFSEVSSSLSEVYEGLESKISLLNKELAETRSQKLREYEEREKVANRLSNLLSVLPGGVIVLDGEGVVQECNPAAEELFGKNLLGVSWRDVVARAVRPQWDDGHDVTLKDGRCVNISTQSLGSEPGQILLITDVTETRQLQEQISGLKRVSAMGEMASAMAHQIRTPLSSALLYVANLGSHKLDEDRRKRFIKKTMSSLQHLETLVEEMLLFARGGRLNTRPLGIHNVLDDFVSQQQHAIEQGELTLSLHNDIDTGVRVKLGRDAFISALQNLLNNAKEAAPGMLDMRIEASCDDTGYVHISITDNGPGIPDSIKSRLFEPFVTTRTNGTGLGLAVVHTVIRAHKGKITVADAETGGSCFTISLPVCNKQTNQVTASSQASK